MFTPDYQNIIDAAYNRVPKRMPLYDHLFCNEIMEEHLGETFASLWHGDDNDLVEYYRKVAAFGVKAGYDTIPVEHCFGAMLPGAGALGGHVDPVIKTRDDFKKYPWNDMPDLYFQTFSRHFEALGKALPAGMKAVGGIGNGVFEIAQDLVGFEGLCYMSVDDPELYADYFVAIGDMMVTVWNRFMEKSYQESYAVLRFGDDLGYKSQTMLSSEDVKTHILPQYKRIVDIVHANDKPFLLHSCGKIFDVMDDLIHIVGIDAKHSNEDQIALFDYWVEEYGDRIGLFGGIDTDHLCRKSEAEIAEIVTHLVEHIAPKGGFALGSGNSIPNYVPYSGFMAMNETARQLRGDFK